MAQVTVFLLPKWEICTEFQAPGSGLRLAQPLQTFGGMNQLMGTHTLPRQHYNLVFFLSLLPRLSKNAFTQEYN